MKPLFLVSLPRSGSTMVQAVLSNHQNIATCPEPWIQLIRMSFMNNDLVRASYSWPLALQAMSECCGDYDLLSDIREKIGQSADQLYKGNSDESTEFFLDKTPRYYLILEELYNAYPDARFIILRRDLISVLASIYKTWLLRKPFSKLDEYSYDLIEGPSMIAAFCGKHGDDPRVRVIDYEHVVRKPHEVFRSIFQWLNLPFEESLLEYSSNKSFRGKFGDPNCNNNANVKPKELASYRSLNELFPAGKWLSFSKGYLRQVRKWNYEGTISGEWNNGRFSNTYTAYVARHYLRLGSSEPSMRQLISLLLNKLRSKFIN
ncbi:sulfotransferase family protein [Haloferula chungangensis]|uniref:Sulfotransferase family protein n=2 Tax=Haloferula chungangensis TaxID=1048331 RepID=A0ABW2LAB2_9BACT